jgi:Flp pilus assembly protein TadB
MSFWAYVLFGIGSVLFLIGLLVNYLERQAMRKWFLTAKEIESSNPIVAYIERQQWILYRMGWDITKTQIVVALFALVDAMAVLPMLFHEPWLLSVIFAIVGAVGFDLGMRLYNLRYNVRFEKGLRSSALLIGIETLTATHGETELAINDILRLSRDKVILREFKIVRNVAQTLRISYEDAMLQRAEYLRVPAYLWLARYTLKLRQFGANTGEAWEDVLEELEDRDLLRTRVLSKTATIRYGAYVFAVGLAGVLLLFYKLISPLMKGLMPFIFALIMVSVSVGIYRMARLGGDLK